MGVDQQRKAVSKDPHGTHARTMRFHSVLNRVTQTTFRSGALSAVRITQQAPSSGSRILKWWSSQRPASEDKAASTVVGRQSRRCTTRARRRYARNSNDPKSCQDGSCRGSTGSCRRWYRSHWARDPIHQAELRQVTGASHTVPALRSVVRAVLEQRGRLTTFSAKGGGRAGRGSLW